ncbi:PDZ domain-containing protein [Candidatus Parcubacteria bacterium]|nr:MAG: PDZ domain-containing protein [Candidatus Parcubacteria bacterium]
MTYEQQVIGVVKKALPAVVSIIVGKDLKALEAQGFPFYGEPPLWGPSEEEIVERLPKTDGGKIRVGGGSGFVVAADGFILTNKHVVADPDAEYTVVAPTEEKFPARVLARDPINDVAILKIDSADVKLPILELGNSNSIVLGQSVVAVGNALGEFRNTVSTGIVSGLSRFVTAVTDMDGHAERLRGLIQTDAAINPGNSGGPLVDLTGNVIGINSAVVFGAQNIGFAIPINKAKQDLADVQKFGRIRKPFLGVRYLALTKELRQKLRAPSDTGALVVNEELNGHAVVPGSAADRAGLRAGDVIIEINGTPITDTMPVEEIIERAAIGDEITISLVRNGKPLTCRAKLTERHEVR